MSVYAESSALLKIYLDDAESDAAEAILVGKRWVTGRHTLVEVRRNLARTLTGADLGRARARFASDWTKLDAIDIDEETAELAAVAAERTGLRSMDALHLGAAELVRHESLPFVTFDRRLAEAARSLGWTVLGA
ncbi:MAG TPA: type II toxin-antitoxin system VapC family toxin [Gaiellaceae bacterium]|nr:type II toxin-antitoxin system VapC family toxin [Gaiellaceae bacterium]